MPKTVIEVNQVTLSFNPGEPPELEDIDLQIREGEIVSLVGPSGCGKSTLLRLISGVLAPTAGEIRVFGQKEIPGWSGLSFVPQDSLLLPWRTALANVRLPLELRGDRLRNRLMSVGRGTGEKPSPALPRDGRQSLSREEMDHRAREALRLANLRGVEDKYPYQLSGGMQKRVALARALVEEARVLLLDEPFAALDAITSSQLHMELLRIQEQTGITVLLVTHNIFEAVFLSRRVVVMGEKPGCIIGEVDVDLDYPRAFEALGSVSFGQKVSAVQEMLRAGWSDYSG